MKIYFLIVFIISSVYASENDNNRFIKQICGVGLYRCDFCKGNPQKCCLKRLEVNFYSAMGCLFLLEGKKDSERLKIFMKNFQI